MKPLYLLAGLAILTASLPHRSAGKPAEAVSKLNQLSAHLGDQGFSAISPAAVFLNLLMLGELTGGELGDLIEETTKSGSWKASAPQPGATTGWLELSGRWWVDKVDSVNDRAQGIAKNFRTEFIPVDFWDRDAVHKSELRDYLGGKSGVGVRGVLVTKARYRPAWSHPVVKAGKHEFFHNDGKTEKLDFIQSHIVPVKLWSESDLEFSMDLEGGGRIFFSAGGGRWEGESEEIPAIVFLPSGKFKDIVSMEKFPLLKKKVGTGARYDKVRDFGDVELTHWVVESEIDFDAATPRVGAGAPKGQPVVIRLNKPFAYKVVGAHGETVMQGTIRGGGRG